MNILHQSKILENRKKSVDKIDNFLEELLTNSEITEPEKKLIKAADTISNLLLKKMPNLHKRNTIQFIQDLE